MLVDSSGWIEFFTDGPLANTYASHLKHPQRLVTPIFNTCLASSILGDQDVTHSYDVRRSARSDHHTAIACGASAGSMAGRNSSPRLPNPSPIPTVT